MSYVQGTTIRLWARFYDTETGEAAQLSEVLMTAERPDGTVATSRLSEGQVTVDQNDPALYHAVLAADQAGMYAYQFEGLGVVDAVVRHRLHVRARIPHIVKASGTTTLSGSGALVATAA